MLGMILPSERAANFHYAIRNVVNAAEALERQGRRIIHLNIGDPQAFGFKSPADVVITSGASEGADLLLTALLNPGDEVILPGPGYPIYAAIINKLDARARYYNLDHKTNWQPSLDEIRS